MKQAVMTAPGVIRFDQVAKMQPGPGEVSARVRRIGICGSDVHVNKGLHPFTTYPLVQGHEWSGVVESVGPGVAGIVPGMKVTATPQVVCGQCKPCRRGDYNICDTLKVQGFQSPGCAQEFFVTRAEKIVPLPESFTFEQGAMVEPVSVAVHSSGRASHLSGKNVVVTGAGTIGNLVAQLCRCRGARVLITDVSDYRLQIASYCRIPHISNARTEGLKDAARRVFGEEGYEVGFECSGVEPALAALVDSVEKGGMIVAVAVYEEKPRVDMSIVGDRELKIVGTLMYKRDDYLRTVELIDSGEIVTVPLESKHFPFDEYSAAYQFVAEQGERCMKVFIDL